MAQKITLNELRKIVKQVINEDQQLQHQQQAQTQNQKTIQAYGPRLMDGLKKNGFDARLINNEDSKTREMVQNSPKKLALVLYEPTIKYISITTNKDNREEAFKVVDSPFVKNLLPNDYQYHKQGQFFVQIQGK